MSEGLCRKAAMGFDPKTPDQLAEFFCRKAVWESKAQQATTSMSEKLRHEAKAEAYMTTAMIIRHTPILKGE